MREPTPAADPIPAATATPVPLPAPPPPTPLPRDPRERLFTEGATRLTDEELLAILLGSNRTGGPRAALDDATALLHAAGGLPALAYQEPGRLQLHGAPASTLAPLTATAEMARRLARARVPDRTVLDHLDELARDLTLRYGRLDHETVGAVYLDARGGRMADEEVFLGGISRCVVEPRPIVVTALDRHASGILLFHTHPSGDPSPSADDLLFTRRMREVCGILGLDFHGHLVLGLGGRWRMVEG